MISKIRIIQTCILLLFSLTIACQKSSTEKSETEILKEMALIPTGAFIMGSDEVDKEMIQQRFGMRKVPYQNEHPMRRIMIGDFYIDKYEVTNKQYKKFVDAAQYPVPSYWKNGIYPQDQENNPVVSVAWFNADAYCRWKGKRLPSEEEWEKAARGTDGRRFAWGNDFNQKKANILGLYGGTTPVGKYKDDVSPYGVYDMVGNVSEWTIDWYKSYPGNDFIDKDYGETYKVLRGGSWGGIGHYSFELFYRTMFRNREKPGITLNDVGIRCAMSKKKM